MASIDDSRTGMRNPSSIADLIVKGAIALVTAAFFIGAYLQFQVTFWLALIAALSVYITLLMLHALMRRSERVEALATEVSRLESELARAKGDEGLPPHRAARTPGAGPAQLTPKPVTPRPVTAKPATVQRPGLAGVPRHELSASAPLPERGAAPAAGLREPPPFGSLSPAAGQAPAKASGAEPVHDYWSFRPSKQAQPEAAPRRAADPAAAAAAPPSASAPSLGTSLSDREADLDDVQGMIKRLADELNLGGDAPESAGPEHAPDQLLRASVDALQTTADTMRAATAKPKTAPSAVRHEQRGGPSMPPPIAPGHTRISAVAAAVAAGRLNVALRSIIGLADHQVHHYDVVLSPRDETGAVLSLAAHDPQLARTGLNPMIDAARFKRASQVCRSLTDAGQKCCVLAAVSGESLGAERFLEEVATAYRQREELANELVPSFGLADVKTFDVTEWSALTDMRDLGFRFALEDVTDVNYEFAALAAAGFTYVKIDASRLLDGLAGPRGLTSAADVCRSFNALGFTVIIEGIDDEATRSAIIECGVTLGAGPLFGPARVIIGDAQAGSAAA